MTKKTTHFGFTEVEHEKKQTLVQDVFSRVAPKYDIMNDLMSFGLHRIWKDAAIRELAPSEDDFLLDVAGGTGDISHKFLSAGGHHATVLDLNEEMLAEGKKKYPADNIDWVHGNAEDLPFEDDQFDMYTVSFGIRNVTNIDKALAEAYRVLKPGGRFLCLEFSNVSNDLVKRFYDLYSFKIIPLIGKFVANSPDSYQYLVESIRQFPKALQFKKMMTDVGFEEIAIRKFSFGVVAMHTGYKIASSSAKNSGNSIVC